MSVRQSVPLDITCLSTSSFSRRDAALVPRMSLCPSAERCGEETVGTALRVHPNDPANSLHAVLHSSCKQLWWVWQSRRPTGRSINHEQVKRQLEEERQIRDAQGEKDSTQTAKAVSRRVREKKLLADDRHMPVLMCGQHHQQPGRRTCAMTSVTRMAAAPAPVSATCPKGLRAFAPCASVLRVRRDARDRSGFPDDEHCSRPVSKQDEQKQQHSVDSFR